MPNGKFGLNHSIAALTKRAGESVAHGRKGLRLVGDTSPFFELGMAQSLMKYEEAVEGRLNLPIIAVCAYSTEKVRTLHDKNIQMLHQHHKQVFGAVVQ
jgi:hypothetical protein